MARRTAKPDLLVLITDQERSVQHWPAGWAEENLPAMQRLRRHGLEFTNAITNTCQCSPARATLHTSTYPAEHGVHTTFGTGPGLRPPSLAQHVNNFARTLAAAGYHVAYKGKWHLSRPINRPGIEPGTWTARDRDILRERFGYAGWNPPDAGNSLSDLRTLGAGKAKHDRRYLTGRTTRNAGPGYGEGVIPFLQRYDGDRPLCLFVSLINPHDVFVCPGQLEEAGFRRRDFARLPIDLPASYREDLSRKPLVHEFLNYYFDRTDPLAGEEQALDYVRFYAWLHKVVDRQIGDLLDALPRIRTGRDLVVVRTSDHGEMGMAHGGMRQKEYNCYEETIRIPLLISSPAYFDRPATTPALAGLVDLLPTVARIAGAPAETRRAFRGADLTPVLNDPSREVQDAVHFTYDDDFLPDVGVPKYIRALRTRDWKYAVYFHPILAQFEYECYDLRLDPLEMNNLAHPGHAGAAPLRELHTRLYDVMVRNRTLPQTVEWPGAPDGAPRATARAS